jgi:hypothetical protein
VRTYADEVERGEARFLLLPTVTMLVIGLGVLLHGEWPGGLSEALEQRGAGAAGCGFAAVLCGGMALAKGLVYARLHFGEEGLVLGPKYVFGTKRNFRWADVTSWYEERYTDPRRDEEELASTRLVVERAGQPPVHFPEHWRWALEEELERRRVEQLRNEARRKVAGALSPFRPGGNEKATTIQP